MIIEVNPSDAGDVADLAARKQNIIQNAEVTFSANAWTLDTSDNLYKQTVQIGQGVSQNFAFVYNSPSVIAAPSADTSGLVLINGVLISEFSKVPNALSYSATATAKSAPAGNVSFTLVIYGGNDTTDPPAQTS